MSAEGITFLIVAGSVALVALALSGLRIAQEYERAVVFRPSPARVGPNRRSRTPDPWTCSWATLQQEREADRAGPGSRPFTPRPSAHPTCWVLAKRAWGPAGEKVGRAAGEATSRLQGGIPPEGGGKGLAVGPGIQGGHRGPGANGRGGRARSLPPAAGAAGAEPNGPVPQDESQGGRQGPGLRGGRQGEGRRGGMRAPGPDVEGNPGRRTQGARFQRLQGELPRPRPLGGGPAAPVARPGGGKAREYLRKDGRKGHG
jgi:hypothetical protein